MKAAGAIENKVYILSNLKALYCFMEGSDIPDFKSFCQLFDLADGEYLNELIEKIKFVFEVVLNGSTGTAKTHSAQSRTFAVVRQNQSEEIAQPQKRLDCAAVYNVNAKVRRA